MRHLHPTFPCIALLFHSASYLSPSPISSHFPPRSLYGVVDASRYLYMHSDVYSREKSGKYCTITHVIPVSFPSLPFCTYASCTISSLPSHQEYRDVACIFMTAMPSMDKLSANESVVRRNIFRYSWNYKSPFGISHLHFSVP